MKYFMFEKCATGEKFLVTASTIEEAFNVARDNFSNFDYVCEVNEEEVIDVLLSVWDEY